MTIDGFWHIEHSIGFHMKNQFTFGNWKACLCTEGAICMAYMVKCANVWPANSALCIYVSTHIVETVK